LQQFLLLTWSITVLFFRGWIEEILTLRFTVAYLYHYCNLMSFMTLNVAGLQLSFSKPN